MKKLVSALVAIAVASLLVVAIAVGAAQGTYKAMASLTPGADVPTPKGATGAKGSFVGSYKENASGGAVLSWTLSFSGLTGSALQAHIHLGKVGKSGNVLVPLCGPCSSGGKGTAKFTKQVIAALESGSAYVNVHTKKNPAGEIRGQIKVTG